VGRSFLIAACIEGWIVLFVVIASGIDVMVGEVLSKICNGFFEGFIGGEQGSGTESES